MKWKRYRKDKIDIQRPSYRSLQTELKFYQYTEQEEEEEEEESSLADYKDIFKKVTY